MKSFFCFNQLAIMGSLDNYAIPDVEKVLVLDGRKVTKINIARLTAPGENYISLVFRLDVEVVDANGNSETIHGVAKRLPLTSGDKEPWGDFSALAMKVEIDWYRRIVPLFQNFAKEFGLQYDYFPTYLGSRLSLNDDSQEADSEAVLVVKNLHPEGYANEDRHEGFTLETAKSILKSLAAFHATGFGIKFKQPENFKILEDFFEKSKPKPPADKPDNPPPEMPEDMLIGKLLELPDFEQYKSQLQYRKDNQLPIMERFFGGGLEPWNTVMHADFWGNNIMITKPQENGGIGVKILDYQVCKYSTYSRDLIFFLLTSLRDEVAKHHFDNLLRFYYDELTSLLEKIDIPELKLTYQDFEEELNRVVPKYEALHALFFCVIIFAPKNNVQDHLTGEVNALNKMTNMMNNLSDRQKERLKIVLDICTKKGWI